MRKFASAMLAMVMITTLAIAQTKTYEVKNGDTLGAIASKYGVSTQDLVRANSLANSHKLKLGQKLRIPAASSKTTKKSNVVATSGGYAVRNGDNDWNIAKRFGITSSKLRAMNAGVDWKNLKIGTRLNVPGRATTSASAKATLAAATTKASTTTYKVKEGDNDWLIAKRFGTTSPKIRAANPGVNWERLKIGTVLRVPTSKPAAQLASSSTSLNSRYAVISKDNVVVRRKPTTNSSKVTTVSAGTPVTVVNKKDGWYQVKFPRGTVAWVRGDMLKASASRPASALASIKRPSSSKTVASKTPARSAPASRNTRDRYASYVGSGSGNRAVDTAMSMMGTRYRYGGSSRSGTDCSGLVIQAYSGQVKLPRTSAQMATVGKPISKDALKAGDLVFFRTRGSRISHVGIYKGGGKFVHSSSGQGRVTVSSLSDGYYSRRYAGARRVVKSSSSAKNDPPKKAAIVEARPDLDPAKPETSPKPTLGTTDIIE